MILLPIAENSSHGRGDRRSIHVLDTTQVTLNKSFFERGQFMQANG